MRDLQFLQRGRGGLGVRGGREFFLQRQRRVVFLLRRADRRVGGFDLVERRQREEAERAYPGGRGDQAVQDPG